MKQPVKRRGVCVCICLDDMCIGVVEIIPLDVPAGLQHAVRTLNDGDWIAVLYHQYQKTEVDDIVSSDEMFRNGTEDVPVVHGDIVWQPLSRWGFGEIDVEAIEDS